MARTNRSTYVVLGLLARGPQSGYEIKRAIDDVIGHIWRESFGQIYPVLRRLQARRLVTKKRADSGARRRHEYTLTSKGRAALAAWLRTAPQPESIRHELLLKVFFAGVSATGTLAKHVKAYRARSESLRRRLVEGKRDLGAFSEHALHVRLTMLHGQYVAAARVRWANEALRVLERSADKSGR